MDKIFLIYNAENSDDEEEVVAVFNDPEVAAAFTERHPRFHGRYRIEEKELNPYFEKTDKWVYLVTIDPDERRKQAHLIAAFDEEQLAYHNPVSKNDDAFFMYLFATDKNEALVQATARFDEMAANGEWLLLKDEADDNDDD